VVAEGWWDYEGAPEQYTYEWFLNGRLLGNETEAVLDMSLVPANALVHCVVTPVNQPVAGKPADGADPLPEFCAMVADVKPGWNLVYAPSGEGGGRGVPEGSLGVSRDVPVVADGKVWVHDPAFGFRQDGHFMAGCGFWARGSAVRTGPSLFLGRRPSQAEEWQTGWRVVGVSAETWAPDTVLSGRPRNELSLWVWDAVGRRYAPVQEEQPLVPGVGYWGFPTSAR
jgi:hypothetical protein